MLVKLGEEVVALARTLIATGVGEDVLAFPAEDCVLLRRLRQGPATVSELAEIRNVTAGAATRKVSTMEEHGLLVRNGRREIRITPKGSALIDDVAIARAAIAAKISKHFSKEEIESATSTVVRFAGLIRSLFPSEE
jgi:DNA-binding MarR family transcriptional regulator